MTGAAWDCFVGASATCTDVQRGVAQARAARTCRHGSGGLRGVVGPEATGTSGEASGLCAVRMTRRSTGVLGSRWRELRVWTCDGQAMARVRRERLRRAQF